MIADPADILADVESALRHWHIVPEHIRLVSPFAEQKRSRFAYRVDSSDGRTLKLRHVGTVVEARRVFDLCTRMEDAFAAVLAHHGPVLLESWIDGHYLDECGADAWATEAGTILARLHTTPLPPRVPPVYRSRERRTRAEADLDMLRHAGVLTGAEASALQHLLRTGDPVEVPATLVHNDYCAENMLVGTDGRLRIIDNEHVNFGAAGYDLGRTFGRWPMSAAAWARFLDGYRSSSRRCPQRCRSGASPPPCAARGFVANDSRTASRHLSPCSAASSPLPRRRTTRRHDGNCRRLLHAGSGTPPAPARGGFTRCAPGDTWSTS